jgi:ATP-dependent DNA ligase
VTVTAGRASTASAAAGMTTFLYAFDLIELNGDDLRRDPLEVRKASLASVLAKVAPDLRLNERLEHEGGVPA